MDKTSNKQNDKVNICGISISNLNTRCVLGMIEELILGKSYSYIVTSNVDHLVKCRVDQEFRNIYYSANIVTADGMPLLWAADYLGTPLKEKISGSDLFLEICELSSHKGYKIYLLGGKPGSAKKSAERLKERYPRLNIAGVYCPDYGFEADENENKLIIDKIIRAKPDVLFVGLGAPKQEKWIYYNKDKYQVPVSIGIGATFDFVSGMVKRAPVWMQKTGLEWFWRLMMEPGRLWKRYLIDDPVFFWLVLKQKLGLLK
jgi:N-acetylglucosaminyldiphosphoundecaprenol N-acetyl-beta-D-mannosaminyltransferase